MKHNEYLSGTMNIHVVLGIFIRHHEYSYCSCAELQRSLRSVLRRAALNFKKITVRVAREQGWKVAAPPLPLLKFKSSGATAISATATLPRNSYKKVAYATGLNLPFLSQTSTSSRRSYMKHSFW